VTTAELPTEPTVSSTDHVLTELDGHVFTVTMNRPEVRNAWSGEMLTGLAEAWERIDEDEAIRVAILTGAGGTFCAGADLKAMSASRRSGGDDGFTEGIRTRTTTPFEGMLRSRNVTKPLIAAVEGYALAGGTEILQATDIRVASERAVFGLTEVQRSLFPLGGSTVRLQRQVPYTRAMEILLLGEHLSAQEALDIGLVGRLVPEGEALEEARRLADRIARNGPLAVQAIKRSVRETADMTEADGLQRELEIGMQVFGSEDAKEGARAFAEKRDPVYRGR
jgi:enoyl-CoA hydratase